MEAACKGGQMGDKNKGGQIIGILPSGNKKDANDYVDIAILRIPATMDTHSGF
jgi:predicted Rossmann-fold nucleotide-binding protein